MELKLTPEELRQELLKRNYVVDFEKAIEIHSALMTRPVSGAFLLGPAGVGKTSLTGLLADILNAKYFVKQLTKDHTFDDLIVKFQMGDDGKPYRVDEILTLAALETLKGNNVILTLDEFDKTRESADAYLLDFLQTGRIRHRGINLDADLSKLSVFITTNETREISEYLTRRLPFIRLNRPDVDLVRRLLVEKGHKDNEYLSVALLYYVVMGKLADEKLISEKAATIQELESFLNAVKLYKDYLTDKVLKTLIKDFIVKSEEDMHTITMYLKENPKEAADIISKKYYNDDEPISSVLSKVQKNIKESNRDTQNIEGQEIEEKKLSEAPFKISYYEDQDLPKTKPIKVDDDYKTSVSIPYNEKIASYLIRKEVLDADIKSLDKVDFSTNIGKFRIVSGNNKNYIVSDEPLNLNNEKEREIYNELCNFIDMLDIDMLDNEKDNTRDSFVIIKKSIDLGGANLIDVVKFSDKLQDYGLKIDNGKVRHVMFQSKDDPCKFDIDILLSQKGKHLYINAFSVYNKDRIEKLNSFIDSIEKNVNIIRDFKEIEQDNFELVLSNDISDLKNINNAPYDTGYNKAQLLLYAKDDKETQTKLYIPIVVHYISNKNLGDVKIKCYGFFDVKEFAERKGIKDIIVEKIDTNKALYEVRNIESKGLNDFISDKSIYVGSDTISDPSIITNSRGEKKQLFITRAIESVFNDSNSKCVIANIYEEPFTHFIDDYDKLFLVNPSMIVTNFNISDKAIDYTKESILNNPKIEKTIRELLVTSQKQIIDNGLKQMLTYLGNFKLLKEKVEHLSR